MEPKYLAQGRLERLERAHANDLQKVKVAKERAAASLRRLRLYRKLMQQKTPHAL